eukprot:TRINITY_DN9449_c0_g1_i2.p1 TRINITY_DN9449_c0_g1~~TRINITY_DN9449_c0_g1_i2.p1  ORF type:complete len:307 (-),score=62.31 TRINITY_DN9449_c0_g1_i2:685-1605(-)
MTESSRKGGLSTWKELCELYDAFIFDQFGVMHNGATSLPGAPELLSKLCKMGKQLVILSNSSKRAEWALAELPKLGIDSSAFIGAVTSGEEAWRALRRDWSGSKCVWLAKRDGSGVTGYLDGTGVALGSVEVASLILNSGTSTIRDGSTVIDVDCEETGNLEPYSTLFKTAIQRGLPMICANPDFISPAKPGGKETHQPGHLARFYEELGGQVLYYGKPEKEHFHACVRMLGLERQRIAHVGDSMHHDVTGALNAEIPVVFVAGGIEHKDLGISPGSTPNSDQLEALFLRYGAVPTHTVPLARWSE